MSNDNMREFFTEADKIQHKPISDQQWSEAVECYQRAKLMTDAVSDLAAAVAERDDYRDEFSGLCHTLSVGSEGRPEMTAADWRKRVDQGIEFLIRPLQERAERAEAELARLRGRHQITTSGTERHSTPSQCRRRN